MAVAVLSNKAARRLFMERHALAEAPAGSGRGADLLDLISRLGFVQIDSVNTLARAHDLILFSRRPAYRPKSLQWLLERDRTLFEHWTHDAAAIPMSLLPHWHRRFSRKAEKMARKWEDWQGHPVLQNAEKVLDHIRKNGCCGSGELAEGPRPSGGWWDWHPSKTAMEYLWHTGKLAISRRQNFRKIYDLAERIYPEVDIPSEEETLDSLCWGAIDRLGFATPGEIAAFWDHHVPAEVRPWAMRQVELGELEWIDVIGTDGKPRRSLSRPGVLAAADKVTSIPTRLRVLSPFDPALRDRSRAERLFGFHYRIEIFVPEPKRKYGYYVFPMLEGERLVGRVDMKTDRQRDVIEVKALWPETGVSWGKGRQERFDTELERLVRFAGVGRVEYRKGWLREPM